MPLVRQCHPCHRFPQVNETYLSVLETIVNNLGARGIYTILDAHQDDWSPRFAVSCIVLKRRILVLATVATACAKRATTAASLEHRQRKLSSAGDLSLLGRSRWGDSRATATVHFTHLAV